VCDGRAAASIFSGRHDFTQFANLMPTEQFRNPVKDIERCEVVDMLDGFRIEVRRGINAKSFRCQTRALRCLCMYAPALSARALWVSCAFVRHAQ